LIKTKVAYIIDIEKNKNQYTVTCLGAWAAQGKCFRESNNFLSLLQVFLCEAAARIILLIYCSSPYE
jgi:hypothetical protein